MLNGNPDHVTPTATLMLDQNQLIDIRMCLLREIRRMNEVERSLITGSVDSDLSAALSLRADRFDKIYGVINSALSDIENPKR